MGFDLIPTAPADKPSNPFEDFARATVHSAIEDPVNGVGQLINHTFGTHLPQLDIVDTPSDNIWSRTGNILGASIDFILLSKATDGLYAKAGLQNKILTTGITGALFELTRPVDENTNKNYWLAKGRNETVAFATFATMAGADQILQQHTKLFGTPATRTLMQDVALGAASAAPGGFVDAQLNSVLQGKGLTSHFAGDVVSYAAFGGFTNGIGHGYQKLHGGDWMRDVMFDGLGKKVEPYRTSFSSILGTHNEPARRVPLTPRVQGHDFDKPLISGPDRSPSRLDFRVQSVPEFISTAS